MFNKMGTVNEFITVSFIQLEQYINVQDEALAK